MRLVVFWLAACGGASTPTPTPAQGPDDWPEQGLCVPTDTGLDRCVGVVRADGAHLRDAITVYLGGPMPLGVEPRHAKGARRLLGPLRDRGYLLGGYAMRSASRDPETLRLTGITESDDRIDRGVYIFVERGAQGWRVTGLAPFANPHQAEQPPPR